jgi:hypothetical protein
MVEKFLVTNVPGTWLCVGIVAIAVAVSLLGLVLVRRSVELRQLRSLHDVAGFILAVVGVLYAVLLGFMVVVQWEQYSAAASDASDEAGAALDLYRDAVALGPAGRPLATAVRSYTEQLINVDYPYVAEHLEGAPAVSRAVTSVLKPVIKLRELAPRDSFFVNQAVEDATAVSQTRRTRIEESSATLPGPLWLALLAGGVLTVGFTFFFGLESFNAQAMMVSALAVIIGLSLFVILDFDLPFSGQTAIKPKSLKSDLDEFCLYDLANPRTGEHCNAQASGTAVP